MANIYTNQDGNKLSDHIIKFMNKADEMKFLSGFFYFSGIDTLLEGLRANKDRIHLQILVGLNAEPAITAAGKILAETEDTENYDSQKKSNYLKSVRSLMSSEDNDRQEFGETLQLYIDLLNSGRLKIRKTKAANHSKLYIFKCNDDIEENRYITGSANLTRKGLALQNEFNIEIHGAPDAAAAAKYFDDLWDTSIDLTNDDEVKRELLNILKVNPSMPQEPFTVYTAVLKNYIEAEEIRDQQTAHIEADTKYKKFAYQTDAVNQACHIIEKYNGVILADVVGLGKSVIAGRILNALGKKAVIICPPGLVGDVTGGGWEQYKEDFELRGQVFSLGKLNDRDNFSEIMNYCNEYEPEIVLVDEAHRFRNSKTQTYDKLKQICFGRKVILLTATPYNNSPMDLLALLQLFTAPKSSCLGIDGNIRQRIRAADRALRTLYRIKRLLKSDQYNEALNIWQRDIDPKTDSITLALADSKITEISSDIKEIIAPVVVRRNRLDLLENPAYSRDIPEMSVIDAPVSKGCALTEEQSRLYDEVLLFFSDMSPEDRAKAGILAPTLRQYTGAVYRPIGYAKPINGDTDEEFTKMSQRNLAAFMKRLVVKRLESCFGAFDETLNNFINKYRNTKEIIEKNNNQYIYDQKLLFKLEGADAEDYEDIIDSFFEDSSRDKYTYDFSDPKLKAEYFADIDSDIEAFEYFRKRLREVGLIDNDPKFETLRELIADITNAPAQSNEPKRKIIVFTEYADTVAHLKQRFDREGGGLLNVKFDRILFVDNDDREKILKNFDASIPKEQQADDYDVIVATDKLSEGFNLHRAGAVINYDIPWNPVRVIQRVGRINRIGSKVFEHLQIYNFFPGEKSKDTLNLTDIAKNKIFMIHNILGEDVQLLTAEETPTSSSLYEKLSALPEEKAGTMTLLRKELEQIKAEHPDVYEAACRVPDNIKTAKAYAEDIDVFFARRKGSLFSAVCSGGKLKEIPANKAIDYIRCPYGTKAIDIPQGFWNDYPKHKASIKKGVLTNSSMQLKGNELDARNILKTELRNPLFADVKDLLKAIITDIEKCGGILTTEAFCKSIKDTENKPKELLAFLKTRFAGNKAQEYIRSVNVSDKTDIDLVVSIADRIENIDPAVSAAGRSTETVNGKNAEAVTEEQSN